jgi:hypothetical protein
LSEDTDSRQNQAKKNCSIERASIVQLQRITPPGRRDGIEPTAGEFGPGKAKPNERNPKRGAHLPPVAGLSPKEKENGCECKNKK